MRRAHREEAALRAEALHVIAFQVRLSGQPRARRKVTAAIAELSEDHLSFTADSQALVAAKLLDDTRPACDLSALSSTRSPLGVMAKLLDSLDAGEPLPKELHHALRQAIAAPKGHTPEPLDDPALTQLARSCAADLLDALLEQQEALNPTHPDDDNDGSPRAA